MTENKYWVYLENLRKSGVTNMRAAIDWLVHKFLISTKEAKEIFIDWIKNYNPNDYSV